MTLYRAAVVPVLLVLAVSAVHAANRYDPRLTFRTLSTEHFDIHFHQGEELLARRLTRIAEDVADRLAGELGRPSGRVHVILVNQTDLSNGWATPVPYNLIEITVVPPPAESSIGNTDDWLRLVFSHEYTHIVHLGASQGWIGGLRHVFGRLPALFPNLFLPAWQVEGIATYDESALTGEGRVPAGDFRMILDEGARSRRFEPIDRPSGGLVPWPSGHAPYVYGGYFHQYLADRYGAESIGRLSKETAGRLPFFGSRAFKKVFGRSLGGLWEDFEQDTRARAPAREDASTRLTHHGFTVATPRFSADGRLFYAVQNPHGFPALMELPPGQSTPRRITTRYLGGRFAVGGDTLVFDQLDLIRNVAMQSDLYSVGTDGERVRRLTQGSRAAEPDLSPDGRLIACTVQLVDRREIATLPFAAIDRPAQPITLISEPATELSSPRWSPDGHRLVAERRRLGGPSEIVVIDVGSRVVTPIAASARGRNVGPVWAQDGRSVVFASDRNGGAFAIYEVAIATGTLRRLEGTGTSAQSPVFSPDGRSIVFVGYTADGYDLFSLSTDSAQWVDVPTETSSRPIADPVTEVLSARVVETYRPWRTLWPRAWSPVIESDAGEVRAGADVFGTDVLGRHALVASIAWSASRSRPDWWVAYGYDRWWPTVVADVSSDVDPWRGGETQSMEGNIGGLFPLRRVRWMSLLLAAFHASTDRFDCAACEPLVNAVARRRGIRAGWHLNNSRAYGYSVSAEEGGRITLTSEFDRRALGAGGDGGSITLDLRGYRRAFSRHDVFAARIGGASTWGDRAVRRQFNAGGSGASPAAFAFGADAIGLMRGFDTTDVFGPHATVVNIDYRFPIATVQRGIGTLPFFLRTVHGAVFLDLGHGWTGTFRSSEIRRSVGLELSFDSIVGYSLPITLTTGGAWRDDPVRGRGGFAAFGRIGRAF